MEKIEIESGENLIKYKDGSAKVHCSVCGKWEEIMAGSKQRDMLENWPQKAEVWVCTDCWKKDQEEISVERQDDYTRRVQVGQAINLSALEFQRMGKSPLEYKDKFAEMVEGYYVLIQEIQEEHQNGKN